MTTKIPQPQEKGFESKNVLGAADSPLPDHSLEICHLHPQRHQTFWTQTD